jgi:fructose-1,6-bisphosphatase
MIHHHPHTETPTAKAVLGLFAACKEIAYKIRTASCDKMSCFNEFGDEQLAIDILANNVLFQVGCVCIIITSIIDPTKQK